MLIGKVRIATLYQVIYVLAIALKIQILGLLSDKNTAEEKRYHVPDYFNTSNQGSESEPSLRQNRLTLHFILGS